MRVVATAGHVDHGKSALLERLTGMQPDRWDEERRRGLTIDLGYVWTELPTGGDPLTVAFVDVPGHDHFLGNMLCGVGVVEQVLLVVAADDGWSAQSQEHLEILELFERHVVAAVVTKADLAGPKRTTEVITDVGRRLSASTLADAPVLAVDSRSGLGVDELVATIVARLSPVEPDRAGDDTWLWIDRVFTVRGAGTVVTGMLTAGTLQVGQDVEVAPRGLFARIRGLHCLERAVASATAGSRVAVNLAGVGHDAVGRGDALLDRRARGQETGDRFGVGLDAELRALPHATIGRTGAWHLHLATANTTVRVLPLLGDLAPGTRGPARLELSDAIPLRAGDRFVLRDSGRRRTVGGGTVLDPAPLRRRRGTEQRLAHALVLDRLADAEQDGDDEARLVALVDAHGGTRDLGRLRDVVGSRALEPADVSELEVVAGTLVRRTRMEEWSARILAEAVAAPDGQAVELRLLTAAAVEVKCPPALVSAVLERLRADGRLHAHGGRLVHGDHEASYRVASAARRRRLVEVLDATPWAPPDPATAAAEAEVPWFEVQEAVDEGVIVTCGPLLFTADAVATAAERLRSGPGRDGTPFTASNARQALNVSRRSIVPLLDHLRTVGVTTFDGVAHRLVTTRAAHDKDQGQGLDEVHSVS